MEVYKILEKEIGKLLLASLPVISPFLLHYAHGQMSLYSCYYMLIHPSSVTVSLVTIRGTECRVLELGQVADRTGGTVRCGF